jgi:hypothetical protein
LERPQRLVRQSTLKQCLSWVISQEEIRKLDGLQDAFSEATYVNGFYFQLMAQGSGAEGEKQLGGFICLDDRSMKLVFGFETQRLSASVRATLTTPVLKAIDVDLSLPGGGSGLNCLAQTGTTFEELVVPYLEEGRLVLSAEITEVL